MWCYIYMFVCIYILFHGELDLFSLDSIMQFIYLLTIILLINEESWSLFITCLLSITGMCKSI